MGQAGKPALIRIFATELSGVDRENGRLRGFIAIWKAVMSVCLDK